jgi:hypothetical protein
VDRCPAFVALWVARAAPVSLQLNAGLLGGQYSTDMSIHYKHTQIGTLIIVALSITAAVMAIFFKNTMSWRVLAIIGSLLIVGIIFCTLTVEVVGGKIKCWFGPGLIRKEFLLSDITGVDIVRNRWYYGWGIRYTPHGWLFSVSGLDAVSITFSSGKHFRIGTDQPHELEKAIRFGVDLST